MATFGLVHGAWHGAWCWKYLVEELERQGHQTIVMDMPIEDTSLTLQDYAEFVKNSLRSHGDVILVGHSMAGLVIPLVADIFPVKKLVYLCGVLRRPGHSEKQDYEDGLRKDMATENLDGKLWIRKDGFSIPVPEGVMKYLYQDCKPELAKWALSMLRKQYEHWEEISPQKNWPNVPTDYIICEDDKSVNPIWSERLAKEWLHVEPIKMPGSHSPFLSRPKELADILVGL